MEYYASLETGGTKCVCAIGSDPQHIEDYQIFPTLTPQETLPEVIKYFQTHIPTYNIKAMGITSFGPIDVNTNSIRFGYITSTPKIEWQSTDLVGTVKRELGISKVAFDTDVNGAALAEGKWGAAIGLDTFIYITVGTGIGVGVIVNGKPLHGMLHPEGGHIILPIHPKDPSVGFCPFHKNCFEGLASGPTFDKRWGIPAYELDDTHLAWELEINYLATGIANFACSHSPQRIILGGGISKRTSIFPSLRAKVQELLSGYLRTDQILNKIDQYIVPPSLNHSGLLGGLLMASML